MESNKVSFYRDVKDMAGSSGLYIEHIFDGIRTGKWKDVVEPVRALYPSQHLNNEEYKKAKQIYQAAKTKLPNFTISGLFTKCENEGLAKFSGLIGVDFDNLEDTDDFIAQIGTDSYTYGFFKSVSGQGVCVLVKVERERFLDAFLGLEAYYLQRYQALVDPQCKNIGRRRYVSYDPTAQIINPDSPVFKLYLPKPKSKKPEKPLFYVHSNNEIEHIFRQIEDRQIDIAPNYEDWYQLGFAFINEFQEGGLDYFIRASQFNAGFSQTECEKKFNHLLRQKPRTVTIAKFYSLCKKAGIDILSERTKHIAKVAQMQKKAGSSRDSIISSLGKIDAIPREEAKTVVDAVFDSGAAVDTEEGVFDKISLYLSRNYPVRYNEIKHRVEFSQNGQDVDDRQENTLYVKLRSAFGKEVTKPDLLAYLNSDEIESYNPIREFFEKNKHRKPTGVIERLCNSITPRLNAYTKKNLPIYVKYFFTRWLIGIVASAHGDSSPLCLVLVGEGNTGKTWFFRLLLPEELRGYYTESKLDGGKDDAMLLYTKLLIMNDEYGGNAKEAKHFKNLSSKAFVQIRKVYGRHSESIARLAVLCGTSNEIEVIDDPTTLNRRIIPVHVESINHELFNSVDKTDMLMEAYHLWKDGYSHHLNKEEIKMLKACTDQFHEYSLERELVNKYFRKYENGDGGLKEFLSTTEIKIQCELGTAQRVSLRKLGLELKSLGYTQDSRFINGAMKRGYDVVRLN